MAKGATVGAAKKKSAAGIEQKQDQRWSKLAHDPRFGRIDRDKTKVHIDDRFKAMLEDTDFLGEGKMFFLSLQPKKET